MRLDGKGASMRILFIGDVVGQSGCDHVRAVLPSLKREYGIDITIANGENSAEGNGILPYSAKHLMDSGVDIITTGNHGLRRREIYDVMDEKNGIIRPANYHADAPGQGWYFYDHPKFPLCVVNLQGTVYMDSFQNPYECIDALLPQLPSRNIIVDFHAEATSEKLCMAYYLDGKISALLGTHTHVPTADARILPGGTGYMTDVGMCGGRDSVLGVKAQLAIRRMRTLLPTRFENEKENILLNGVIIEIDQKTGVCTKLNPVNI